ncbi:ProQ/FINO family protein [Candidatus Marithrix sp. Canyon 246]|uniref:ProQ/FINO family protein n=1 Tax=Candidatus Marithrix sp. Canyon 246 TaxID=1827136 RepID=UPI0009F1CBE4|nr:ProQ/FINO family protein [Candidatus Marithrix sp. Canyon 246]
MTKKRITKSDLNEIATSLYGDEAYCEYVRSSGKHGWYLNKDTEPNLIGNNVNEAMEWLESQPTVCSEKTDSEKKDVTMLEFLFEKFPKTFFKEAENIRPLQKYIHKKIYKALNYEYPREEISAGLAIYTQNIDYCKSLIAHKIRLDLEGNSCGEVSEQHKQDAEARLMGITSMREPKQNKTHAKEKRLKRPKAEELIKAKLEVCIKINDLPQGSKTLRNGWEEFIIDTQGKTVKITIRPRTWKKLQQASRNYPAWIANIRGTIGTNIKGGFELLTPGVQIFEKTHKEN